MRVFLTIPKKSDSPLIQASRPRWHKGRMRACGGHGGGDEEDAEDTRRQRAHLNTPDSRSGLVTREGGDGFTGRRARAKSATQFSTFTTPQHLSTSLPISRRGGKSMKSSSSDARQGTSRRLVSIETTARPNIAASPELEISSEGSSDILKNAKSRLIGVPQLKVTTGPQFTRWILA
ncbi:hypothetical protein BKA70DRAFT_369352 [Coprinopsis sp. MPI-PUGE-AT-0042]|nr:hypothetical protein BKA70DRAFT_369352 [Coprinopsis sp. MPI-PUGE-AT-0042]